MMLDDFADVLPLRTLVRVLAGVSGDFSLAGVAMFIARLAAEEELLLVCFVMSFFFDVVKFRLWLVISFELSFPPGRELLLEVLKKIS